MDGDHVQRLLADARRALLRVLEVDRSLEASERAALVELAANLERALAARGDADRPLHAILDLLPDYVSRFDREGRHLYANPAILGQLGQTLEQVVGQTPAQLGDPVAPSDGELLLAAVRRCAAEGRPIRLDASWQGPSGRRFAEVHVVPEPDGAGGVASVIAVGRDLTERRRAEEAARRSEREVRTLLENFPDFLVRYDRECRYLYFGPSARRRLEARGIDPDSLIGLTPTQARVAPTPEEDRALEDSLARLIATGEPQVFEAEFDTPDGRRALHEIRRIPELDERGVVISVLSAVRDVSQLKAAEQRSYSLNYALDHVGDAIYIMEGDSPRFSYVNQTAADLLGYERAQLMGGMGVFDIDPAWNAERWATTIPAAREQRHLTFESTHRTRDGRVIPVEIAASWFSYDGRDYKMAVARDISARQAAERALRESEQQYRTLAENTPDMIVRWDRELRRTYVNPAFASAMGRTPEQLIGTRYGSAPTSNALAGEELKNLAERIRTVFATGVASEFETSFHGERGLFVLQLRLVPERGPDGKVATVLAVGRDITALTHKEREVRMLAEHSPDVVARLDRDGRYLYVNRAIEQVTGFPARDFVGRRLGEVTEGSLPPAQSRIYQEIRAHIAQVCASGEPYESEIDLQFLGNERVFNIRLVPESDEDGPVTSALMIVRDVTERHRALEALRVSELRFRQVTENIEEVFWLTNADKTEMIYVSPAYERVYGRSCASLHADPRAWLDAIHPADRARVEEAMAAQATRSYDLEYRIQRGAETRWIHDRAFPIRDASGEIYRIAGVAEDVSVRRELETQLRQAQKMEAVGQLAGGIAHDFNNLLAVIQMQTTLLERKLVDPLAREGVQEILLATDRAANLTRQLLTFSRRHVPLPSNLDISDTIDNLTRLLRRLLGEGISLETRFAAGLPLVHADPAMMEQVLMNLAINARDAMLPEGGKLIIALESVSVSEERAALHPGARAGRHVCLTVADTGCGIAAENLPRIFEPFFTTKEVGKGSGLGLATAFGIVEQHHGWIEVDSAPGQGSSFRVLLPALARDARTSQPAASAEEVRGGDETVFVVEDEPSVRALMRTVLERYGYRVLEAESAVAALQRWNREAPHVDLLLTDLVMPGGMSGRDLAEQLLERRPGLRVMYTSGYSNEVVERMLHAQPGMVLLPKPCSASELAATVRRCLDAK